MRRGGGGESSWRIKDMFWRSVRNPWFFEGLIYLISNRDVEDLHNSEAKKPKANWEITELSVGEST